MVHTMTEPMKLLISGSHGLVGTHAMRVLTSRGHTLTPLVRRYASERSAKVAWLPRENMIESWKMQEMQGVIHLAGESIAGGRWTEERKDSIRQSRVLGTALLARTIAAMPRPPKVFLCASAVGFYGDRGDEWMDEESGPGTGFLADVCREWEAAAQPAVDAGIRTVFLRLGLVLSTTGGVLAKMMPPFRLGLGGVLGHGRQYMSWIGLPDVSNAMAFILENPGIRGPVNLVAPNPVTNREFTATLATALRRPAFFPVPATALRLIFGRDMANECFLSSTRAQPSALARAGFEFRFTELAATIPNLLRHKI
jgi:uncharacterized protein